MLRAPRITASNGASARRLSMIAPPTATASARGAAISIATIICSLACSLSAVVSSIASDCLPASSKRKATYSAPANAASRPESIAEPAHRLDFHLCPGDLPSEMRDVNLNQVGAWLEFVPKHFPKEVAPTDHVTGPPQQKLQQRMLAR